MHSSLISVTHVDCGTSHNPDFPAPQSRVLGAVMQLNLKAVTFSLDLALA